MSSGLNITYPPIAEALYQASSLSDAQKIYVSMLKSTKNIYHAQYAAALELSKRQLSFENLTTLEKNFLDLKSDLRSWSGTSGVKVFLKRRQKDFLGINAKIRRYIASGENLSKIHDILGFRIVLQTDANKDTPETIKNCYLVLNEVIRFFAMNNHLLVAAEPRSSDEITAEKAKELGIIIPEKSLILEGFENNVKDYIKYPNADGYQSLHVLVMSETGLVFETQVRTAFMDYQATHGFCSHNKYKSLKYKSIELGEIDFSRINLPGFRPLENGSFYDNIGLIKSVDPFNLLYEY